MTTTQNNLHGGYLDGAKLVLQARVVVDNGDKIVPNVHFLVAAGRVGLQFSGHHGGHVIDNLSDVVMVTVGKLPIRSKFIQAPQVDHVWGHVCQFHHGTQSVQEVDVAGRTKRVGQNLQFGSLSSLDVDHSYLVCFISWEEVQDIESSVCDLRQLEINNHKIFLKNT